MKKKEKNKENWDEIIITKEDYKKCFETAEPLVLFDKKKQTNQKLKDL